VSVHRQLHVIVLLDPMCSLTCFGGACAECLLGVADIRRVPPPLMNAVSPVMCLIAPSAVLPPHALARAEAFRQGGRVRIRSAACALVPRDG